MVGALTSNRCMEALMTDATTTQPTRHRRRMTPGLMLATAALQAALAGSAVSAPLSEYGPIRMAQASVPSGPPATSPAPAPTATPAPAPAPAPAPPPPRAPEPEKPVY
jgi:hypothetical protein